MKEVEVGNYLIPELLLDRICEAAYWEIKKWAAEQKEETDSE